jgi:prepilin-type N-terminal cleavage/methylation domain-containing protein
MKINSARRLIKSSKGFTLIELLIVIAIIGILAAALLIALDPAEKIRLANDTRAINNVSEVSNKIEQWAVQYNNGVYPANWGSAAAVATDPASPSAPTPPTSAYAFTYTVAANAFTVRVASLQSKKYSGNPGFLYDSVKGKTCSGAATIASCP